jgi:hypothetical protein
MRYPNSGSVQKELQNLYSVIHKTKKTKENIEVIISIIVDIAFRNPRTYPISSAILSKLMTFLSMEKKREIFSKISEKFKKIPNTGLIELWLQRIVINDKAISSVLEEPLCKVAVGQPSEIWNSEWLSKGLRSVIEKTPIVDVKVKNKVKPIIPKKEVALFTNYF